MAPNQLVPALQPDRAARVLAGDTMRARQWYAESRKAWAAAGTVVDRLAWEALDDAWLAFANGRFSEALDAVARTDRLNLERTDIIKALRFLLFDRLQNADSTIVAGEAYLANTHNSRLSQDALYLAGIRQRLGELYEAKGNFDKALTHYQAFVDLWKDADPELQPRVRDVRARVERIQRRRG